MFFFFYKGEPASVCRAEPEKVTHWKKSGLFRFHFSVSLQQNIRKLASCLWLHRKLRKFPAKRAKFPSSWTSETCWRPWRRSSDSRDPSRRPSQSVSQVGALLRRRQVTHSLALKVCPFKSPFCAVGGGLPVVHKQALAQKKPPWQQEKVAHNPLDSTCPLVKKGKQREVPKAKKPTPLKKVCAPFGSETPCVETAFYPRVLLLLPDL